MEETDEIVHIHRRRGYGLSALRKEITSLGVFFYRGDSRVGSNQLWLTLQRGKITHRPHIYEVLDRLVDGGLIVTDGSNCHDDNNPYAVFGKFRHIEGTRVSDEELLQMLEVTFEDESGNRFRCVDYIFDDKKYSVTLFWQFSKCERVNDDRS